MEKVELPQEALSARADLVSLFPLTGLPEVLMEVNRWTPFTQELTHLTSRRKPSAEREASILPVLFAVLVAEATNLGLATMANSSGIPLHELEAVYDWYFREETLRAAIHHLITYHGTLPQKSTPSNCICPAKRHSSHAFTRHSDPACLGLYCAPFRRYTRIFELPDGTAS